MTNGFHPYGSSATVQEEHAADVTSSAAPEQGGPERAVEAKAPRNPQRPDSKKRAK